MPGPRPWYRSPRWIGAALVALVHVVLLGIVMISMPRTIFGLPSPREIYYVFRPQARPKPLPRLVVAPPPSQARPPLFRYAPTPPPQAVITAPPGTNGLQLSLFGCAPENLANLTPEQRERCGTSLAMSSFSSAIPGTVRSLSLDAGRWRAAVTARNTPIAVPCTGTTNVTINSVTMESRPAVMVDPLCVIAKALGNDDK
jgi:hypothetical protein